MNPMDKISKAENNQAQPSPWVFKESKRFPGNFYSFNVSTGETAWCHSETDKKVKNGSMHRETDKSHSYPEPYDPPIADRTKTTYSFSSVQNTGNNDFTHAKTVQPSPVFGQAVFPKYIQPEMSTPRFVWTLTPMYLPNQTPPHWQTMNQTAYEAVAASTQPYEAEQPMFGPHSHNMPFQNQFKPFNRPSVMPGTYQYQNSAPIQTFNEAPMFDQTSNNTFKISQAAQTLGKPLTKDEACQTFAPISKLKHTQSESGSTTKSVDQSRSVEKFNTLFKDIETSTLNSLDKVENEKVKLMKLGKNDLRYKLVAKKRKVETSTEFKKPVNPSGGYRPISNTSDHSIASEIREGPAPMKRVTLDLQEPGAGVTSNGVQESQQVLVTNNINMLSQAKSIDVKCYTVQESKNSDETEPTPNMGLDKLKIIEDNDKKQYIKKVKGVSLNKPNDQSVYPSRLNVFDSAEENKVIFKRVDNSDKLIYLTRPKEKCNTVINSDVSVVNHKIVNLSIADTVPVQNRTKRIVNNVFSNAGNNNKVVRNSMDINDRHNLNRSNQNVKENKRDKSGDAIKVSGITKLNNHNSLDVELQRFCIKSAEMEHRVKIRLDEWACRLNQVMEGVLSDILLKEEVTPNKMMPPRNLFEAIQFTGETFKNQPNIKTVIDLFSMKLLSCSSNNGKLHEDIKPNEFVKLIGYSMILLQHLKAVVNNTELKEAHDRLSELIKNMEDPTTDIDLHIEKVNTPIFSRCDISDVQNPIDFKKSPSEVLDYLKKHFAAWQCENGQETFDDNIHKKPNVLVTCGKDLKTLKINNNRNITVENTDQLKVNQPKVIRNVKIIEAFKERIKTRAELHLEKLDYEDNENVYTTADECEVNEVPDELHEDVLNDLSVSDCAQAYPMAERFLVTLKATLMQIFDFINTSIQEIKVMPMDKKAHMLLKAEFFLQHLLKISERLKTIVARESGTGTTLKKLLTKVGDDKKGDDAIVNYTAILRKFLEEIQKLNEVLLAISNVSPTKSGSQRSHCNTDRESPILPTPRRVRKTVQ